MIFRRKVFTFAQTAIVLLFACPIGLHAQTLWTQYASNPVMDVGANGAWDDGAAFLPCVIKEGDTLKMWYGGADGTLDLARPQTGYAWSLDGITWTKYAGNPVLPKRPGEWDDGGAVPGGVLREGDTLRMWYSGTSAVGPFGPGQSPIGLATSVDGITWNRLSAPVLQPGVVGEWDSDIFFPGNVIKDNGIYKMWYSGGTGTFFSINSHKISIGYATSPDGINWTKYNDPSTSSAPYQYSDPVLIHGSGADFDEDRAWDAWVLKKGEGYEMWYTGGSDDTGQIIMYATSRDGIHWTRLAAPVIHITAPWAPNQAISPSIILDGGQYRMWFTGALGTSAMVGYATAPRDPSPIPGAFTKHGSNPVLNIGTVGAWDGSDVFGPRVLFVDDTLRMWYTGANYGTNNDRIGYAWSTDMGATWTKHPSNPVVDFTQTWENGWVYAPYVTYSHPQGYTMWYVGNDGQGKIGLATSPDGVVWTKDPANPILSPGPSAWESRWIEWPTVITTDSMRLWYGGHNSGLTSSHLGYATSTDGLSWTKDPNPVLSPTPAAWDATFLRSPRVTFDGQTYRMWYSGGTQHANNQKIGFAESSDGRTWTKYSGNPVLQPSPTTWDQTGLFSPEVFFDGMSYHMWFAGYDGTHVRIGYATATAIISSVDRVSENVPQDFELIQNYPNPFNPSTNISFRLQASGVTSLKIFDLLGREVATLVNEELRPGSYEVKWDASGMPSGVYFYRLQAGEFVETKKLLLMR